MLTKHESEYRLFRYPYHHRYWLTSQKHHFANLRDTRDLMERDGPLLENRAKDHYIATRELTPVQVAILEITLR